MTELVRFEIAVQVFTEDCSDRILFLRFGMIYAWKEPDHIEALDSREGVSLYCVGEYGMCGTYQNMVTLTGHHVFG
jgi:hypothetical protein